MIHFTFEIRNSSSGKRVNDKLIWTSICLLPGGGCCLPTGPAVRLVGAGRQRTHPVEGRCEGGSLQRPVPDDHSNLQATGDKH